MVMLVPLKFLHVSFSFQDAATPRCGVYRNRNPPVFRIAAIPIPDRRRLVSPFPVV